ncbi:ArnT family glycosyltransferase [Tunturiibacter gelidoferens]|uniref:4-amino-4-deoxy-L-arabinose transferase-like glycosyltransferase n=1 Tax=Tunturiibacter lichenicola TaxID=2051959 RepID=A0A7Y9NR69_9BACT|nr:glycosyltransferase family 39 protein [Edaphobacter lichenicola]NYF54046.1 4-amino-4-deoxy-L-arabinose transferase-like glycosyltransferase [Edaphobacter lichenicola]
MENPVKTVSGLQETGDRSRAVNRSQLFWLVVLFAAAVYLGCILSPPSLMDDVDAVQAQIAHNMISSGDWVTARLDGVAYLEKPPLIYWMIAVAYKVFGVHDWAARIPIALSAIALCVTTAAFGVWAFGRRAGFYAGLCMSTCIGLFLFTRILVPDVVLTLTIVLAMWAFLRVLDEEEPNPRAWAAILAASLGVGLLLKSLIAIVFPAAAAIIYLLCTRQLFSARMWKRLRPLSGLAIILLIAAPWHILATLRNPPYFSFTMKSVPGEYHGFFWFFFINEQLLRFLNLRSPRDYNTVPRLYFWLLNLVWLFPWSVYLPAALKLSYRPVDRAGRTRLLALCWTGFVLVFFTFSTTQEYYSMPCYPALALLIGSGIAFNGRIVRHGTRFLTVICSIAALAAIAILVAVRHVPTPGDISQALSSNPEAYTLSLGHMEDLTLKSFAYLRIPLALAAASFLIGAIGTLQTAGKKVYVTVAIMMVVFFHAARLAMIDFDPYLSSRPLVNKLLQSPEGNLIVDHHYYWFSSVFFYTDRTALLLNGRFNNLVYGSYAPNAPSVFLDDNQFRDLWQRPERYYIFAKDTGVDHLESLVGKDQLNLLEESGGKVLITNHPVSSSVLPNAP